MYIILVFFFKVIFIVLALTNIYLKTKGKGKENGTLSKSIKYWKERVEFLFVILMALLLIYLFSPRSNRTTLINSETKLLFYLFGFVLLITAKWENFFKESKWVVYLQNALGNRNN